MSHPTLRLVDDANTTAVPIACEHCGQITPALALVVVAGDTAYLIVRDEQLLIRDNHTCKETTP